MRSNDTQVGGDHYKREYQHWDLVIDTDMPYVLGCATKYISRWRKKNGKQDLEKSLHYIHKAYERNILMQDSRRLVDKFCNQLENTIDGDIIKLICSNQFYEAKRLITELQVFAPVVTEPPTFTQG
tara:strand:- start:34339 stop:34716 length:378 start_codon:yes stop_codon:yes gene_type:complete